MQDETLFILIKKYLDGQCTPDEKILIENWYEQQEDNKDSFYDNSPELIQDSASRSYLMVQAAMENDKVQRRQSRLPLFKLYQVIAAAACLIICGAAVLYFNSHQDTVIKYKEITVLAGQVVHLKLSDSSSVSLNAGSHLKYPVEFGSKTRDIYLEGEAYFDVSHDPAKPFKVHTSKLTTTVLGTAFNVTAYKNAANQSVAVIRGKVSVSDDKKVLGLLTPDKRVIYNVTQKTGVISSVSAAALMSWKNGQLQFENEEMEEIADRLERWYGYTFKLEDPNLRKQRYTASFNSTISLKEMLVIMKAISKINYKINEESKTVILY